MACCISGVLTVGQNAAYMAPTAAIASDQPSSERRASQRVLVKTLRSIRASPVAVVREEQFLEVGLLGQQAHHGMLGGGLDQVVGAALQPAAEDRALHGQ